jgi:hypothetical protein
MYGKAIELLYQGDFYIYECYYLMREIIKRDNKNIALFIDVVFTICKELRDVKKKIEIIQGLKEYMEHGMYVEEVSKNIIKTEVYDVLGIGKEKYVMIEECVCRRVSEILRDRNDNKRLLQLYYLFDESDLILKILNEFLTESILSENKVKTVEDVKYKEVMEYYENRGISKECEVMKILRDFLYFKIFKDEVHLRKTALFSGNADFELLSELKPCVEKIAILGSSVVKKVGDRSMARELFNLCGKLVLSDECCVRVDEELIYLL